MTHTPTPWETDDDEIIAPDGDDSPWRIAVCVGDAPNSKTGSENAAFIVTAVNSHDELLAFITKISKFQLASETISPTAPVNQTEGAKVLNRLTNEAREIIKAARP